MTERDPSSAAEPPDFVRVAWTMVKRGPMTVVLRLISDVATNVLAWVVLTVLIVAAFLLATTGPNLALVVGTVGCLAAGLGIFLSLDAVVMGTVWTHAVRTATDHDRRLSATRGLVEGFSRFGDALILRSLNFATRLAVVALFLAWAIPLGVLLTRNEGIFGSAVVLPALVAGVAATLYSIAAGVTALVVELVAPAYFLGCRKLGSAIREAAELVLERPFFVYRIFVTALAVLLPALAFAWIASITYAVTFDNAQLVPLTSLMRGVANLVLFGTLGLFVVMLQYSFFAYYAHRFGKRHSFPPGLFDASAVPERHVSVDELIPHEVVHRVRISEILPPEKPSPEDPAEPPARMDEPEEAPTFPADSPDKALLDKIEKEKPDES